MKELEKERISDPIDRACAEEQAATDEAIREARLKAAREAGPPPTEDGSCACGCGAEVVQARRDLGYGLALGCQERAESQRKHVRRAP